MVEGAHRVCKITIVTEIRKKIKTHLKLETHRVSRPRSSSFGVAMLVIGEGVVDMEGYS